MILLRHTGAVVLQCCIIADLAMPSLSDAGVAVPV